MLSPFALIGGQSLPGGDGGSAIMRLGTLLAVANEVETDAGVTRDSDLADIQATLRGEEQAFARLVKRHQNGLACQMWRFSRDPVVVEELVQDVFVEAYRSLAGFRGQSPFLHWLRRIATRVGYHYWKRITRERRRSVSLDESPAMEFAVEDPTPNEAAEYLFKLLESLPVKDRLILTLHYWEGCDMQEIADRLGWSLTLVKVRAFRARQVLKKKLERAGFGETAHD